LLVCSIPTGNEVTARSMDDISKGKASTKSSAEEEQKPLSVKNRAKAFGGSIKAKKAQSAPRRPAPCDETVRLVKHDAVDGSDIERRLEEIETAEVSNEKDLEIKEMRAQLKAMAQQMADEKAQLQKDKEELRKLKAEEANREDEKKSEEPATDKETKGKGKEEVDDSYGKMYQKVLEDNKRLKMGTPAREQAPRESRQEVRRPRSSKKQAEAEKGKEQRRARNLVKQAEAEKLRAAMNKADDLHACWEFNSWNGCNKGHKCLWSHQWLVSAATHPWTGEKLPGFIERYMNDPKCCADVGIFHKRGRDNVFGGEWDRNNDKMPRWQQDRARW